jgi:hypothetical protein
MRWCWKWRILFDCCCCLLLAWEERNEEGFSDLLLVSWSYSVACDPIGVEELVGR